MLKVIFDSAKHRLPIPDVVIRSHVHSYANTGDMFDTTGVVTPPWQLRTSFGWKVEPDMVVAEIGGLAFDCADGEWQLHKFLYSAAPPKEIIA